MVNWLLAGPAGPEGRALLGGLRLHAYKQTKILTYFQAKVNKKLATDFTDFTGLFGHKKVQKREEKLAISCLNSFDGSTVRLVRHFDWFDKLTTGKLSAGKLSAGKLSTNRLRTGNRDFLTLTKVEKEFRIWVPDKDQVNWVPANNVRGSTLRFEGLRCATRVKFGEQRR